MTKKKNANRPLRMLNDCEHSIEVVNWALKNKLPIRRPGDYHLKIGPINYYPTKQTFNSDTAPAAKLAGYEPFKLAVQKWIEAQRKRVESLED